MTDDPVGAADPFERFVLLAVADLTRRGEAPARSDTVLSWCRDHEDDAPAPRGVTERAVIDALESLQATGLLAREETRSPVGKGRPAHALAVAPAGVFDALADDDAVGDLAAAKRDGDGGD